MDSEDEFLPPNQFRTQYRSNSQTVTSSSARPNATPGASQAVPGTSRGLSQENQLSQIQEGMVFLLNSLQKITGSQLEHRGIKRPAEQKPFDKKPNTKEECQLCKKLFANKTTLFRHYRAIHKEMNPEEHHGCSLNKTVVSLDVSLRENECSICGYVGLNETALAQHNRSTHSNVTNVNNTNKENINNNAANNVKDKMYKCEDCACYFEERSKFDEHMKLQHGFEVVCKICNKNFLFKDIDRHVKDSHPDIYKNKDKDEKKEKLIIKKVMRKNGKRVHLFMCTKCDHKFNNSNEARKHARNHKKGLKVRVALGNKVSNSEENVIDLRSNDDVIFTCEACDVSTGSYDAVVEHSQNHITSMLNNNNTQLVTQTCPVCDLKFEPLCYKTHMDMHYKNKEIHKETFKYFKYRFQLLLNDNWVNSFNMDEAVMKNIICKSIYAKTRSVKMRVLHEGLDTLYKCCQCDNFVDPAAVVNHTLNYDTCVKVKSSYACDICKRKFNNRLTRDKHAKDHNGGESFKIVLFNNDRDKEFNKLLNDPRLIVYDVTNNSVNAEHSNNINDHAKVIYKCLCGLCFVRKESADVHAKICPGKGLKKSCPKCNYLFDAEELLTHYFEHHLNETRVIVENIIPDVIEIESDEEPENENNTAKQPDTGNNIVIEIDSSDDDDQETHGCDNIKINIVKSEDVNSNKAEIDKQNSEAHDSTVAEAFGPNIEQSSGTGLGTLPTATGTINKDTGIYSRENILREVDNNDSEDTITYESSDSDATDPAPTVFNEIKCVPTNLLLNPFNLQNDFLHGVEIVRRQIETEYSRIDLFKDGAIKEERSWLLDPTDYSNISRRPALQASSTRMQVTFESLLTDDEEDEGIQSNEEIEPSVMPERTSNNTGSVEGIERNRNNGELISQLIVVNEDNIQPELNENHIDKQLDTQTNKDGTDNNINNSNDINTENYEDSDDDIFLPSGKDNNNVSHSSNLDNHDNDSSKDMLNKNKESSEQDSANKENIPNHIESGNVHMENIDTNGKEIHELVNIVSETRTNTSLSLDNNIERQDVTHGTQLENDLISTERDVIQSNNEEDTLDFEANNLEKRLTVETANNNGMEVELAGYKNISTNPASPMNLVAIKKEFRKYMNMKIKTELIARNSQNSEIDCDNSLVEVKTEPIDGSQLGYQNVDDSAIANVDRCCVC